NRARGTKTAPARHSEAGPAVAEGSGGCREIKRKRPRPPLWESQRSCRTLDQAWRPIDGFVDYYIRPLSGLDHWAPAGASGPRDDRKKPRPELSTQAGWRSGRTRASARERARHAVCVCASGPRLVLVRLRLLPRAEAPGPDGSLPHLGKLLTVTRTALACAC